MMISTVWNRSLVHKSLCDTLSSEMTQSIVSFAVNSVSSHLITCGIMWNARLERNEWNDKLDSPPQQVTINTSLWRLIGYLISAVLLKIPCNLMGDPPFINKYGSMTSRLRGSSQPIITNLPGQLSWWAHHHIKRERVRRERILFPPLSLFLLLLTTHTEVWITEKHHSLITKQDRSLIKNRVPDHD